MVCMLQRHSKQVSRRDDYVNDIKTATSVILYINIIFIAKWLYGADFQF